MTPTSEPDSTNAVPKEQAYIAARPGLSQRGSGSRNHRRCRSSPPVSPAATSTSACSVVVTPAGAAATLRSRGFNAASSTPDSASPSPIAISAAGAPTWRTATTTSGGPATKLASTSTESSANAARLDRTGTITPMACRSTVNTGTASAPASSETGISTQYGLNAAAVHSTGMASTLGTSARRSPTRSTRRPRQGLPKAIPIVSAAVTRPASR